MERLLLESAIRCTVIAAAIAPVLWAARIKTPSVLHAVWTGVVIAMLLMPLSIVWGPKAAMPVLPATGPAAPVSLIGTVSAMTSATTGVVSSPTNRIASTPNATWSLQRIALIAYLVVALALLVRLAVGTAGTHRLRRHAVLRSGRLTSETFPSPVTVGWLRPVVILPRTWEQWSDSQLDAVLTHEQAHVRRRDPLVQWLALLNRAVFWFHPLAWWLERRLSVLAEQSCDDAVLERGHHPQDYSEYLLDTARAAGRTRLNLAGVFMPGSDLPKRIRRILDDSRNSRVSRARLVGAFAACASAIVIGTAATPARALQQSAARIVVRPVQPRWLPPEANVPQPVSLEWLNGDEWAFEVQSISTADELKEYGELRAAQQRDDFIERFWARRDPTPGTTANELRDEFTRRVTFARERLNDPGSAGTPGFDTDRGRIYLMFGGPDSIESRSVGNGVDERWHYEGVAEMGGDVTVRFLPNRGAYCAYRIVSPAPLRNGGPVPGRADLPSVALYPLGLTAISIPVDGENVSGAGWDLYNSRGVQVDHSEIGWLETDGSRDPLSRHLPSGWLEGGVGCTHALPADTYTLSTAVRSTTGMIMRLNTKFQVQ